ncbi:hypothetical protein DOM22_05345 [Bdellovibrio sp. ZAP7]|uniref:hypothetical protein n=1 Tax=Bdellovibrio sp. ZAP7 TaxID=2231053 RepID=UPI001156CE3D|nr:hypothetical protein [Bdellovibrio sp. ZAP7]QDK44626.1 hypothetical protein DOM22_05345 [Bdellovibrio sp. ZAP7]
MSELKNPTSDIIDLRRYQAEIKSISGQKDLSHFDVSKYLPPGIKVDFIEKGGALFVPHRINEFSVKVIRRKIDLIVFQCILRYTLGFHRPAARLSNTFIATWTGLQPPNVRKALRSLKEMGLVTILVPGTASSTTLYDVPIVRGYLEWRRARENDAKVGSTVSHEGDQSDPRGRFNEISKKENLNKTGKKTPSPSEALPHKISNYIESVRPHQKRVEEEYYLNLLLQDYPADDLGEALDHILIHGSLDTGEKIHSPMKYLSYTAEEVISSIHQSKEKALRREELRKKKEQDLQMQDARKKMEAEEMAKALIEFRELSAEDQSRQTEEYRKIQFGDYNQMMPPSEVMQKLVAAHWYNGKRSHG